MWQHTRSVVQYREQARLLVVCSAWLGLFDLDIFQMVHWFYVAYLHRLVDGDYKEVSGQGLCMEGQALVLRQKENLLLP